ncbi:MAG: thioredoxin family protein [Chloroflexi bacterium]|nr:thioredoxin family protein [Chloroflexota bacterium]
MTRRTVGTRDARRAGLGFAIAVVAALGGLAVAACGSDEARPETIPGAAVAVDDPFSGGYPTYDHATTGIRVVFGTPDIAVGTARISFALFDRDGIVSEPSIEATLQHYPEGAAGAPTSPRAVALTFRPFPDGGRGIYTSQVQLDHAGLWSIDVPVEVSGRRERVTFPITVGTATVAPGIGAPAPASQNRTLNDESNLDRLTTASAPDRRLYERAIADVIAAKEPFVVVFASPAFCTNALCGPQVEVATELADRYGGQAEFIHVDLYENPTEIRGDLSVARRTPVLDEWGLHTDEWTFVVDASGIVRARFEGFAPREEVEAALVEVLPTQD